VLCPGWDSNPRPLVDGEEALPCRGLRFPNPWSSTPQARSRCIRNSPAVPPLAFSAALSTELPGHTQRGRGSNPHTPG
jgi:hypothetical protein